MITPLKHWTQTWFTASDDYPFGTLNTNLFYSFWWLPLWNIEHKLDLQLLMITPLKHWTQTWFTASDDYPFGTLKVCVQCSKGVIIRSCQSSFTFSRVINVLHTSQWKASIFFRQQYKGCGYGSLTPFSTILHLYQSVLLVEESGTHEESLWQVLIT
jgi:hypothetical protein